MRKTPGNQNDFRVFLQMDLSETYSNNYKIIRDFVKSHATTHVNSDIEQCINNTTYDPNCIVKTIWLSI